jgi:hypothetical protein
MAVEIANDRDDPLKKALTHGLALWAIVGPLWLVVANALGHEFAFDVHYAFVPAARAVLHGASPYSGVSSEALRHGMAYLYPPLAAYLFVPFTVLPPLVADVLATALVVAAVPATLLVLGVRDWRCHAVAFLWVPVVAGLQSAKLTLAMVFALALAWRYRDRKVVVALLTGFVVALKLFFWPLLVWLVATRRYRSAAVAAAASTALVLVPWAGIGFAGLRGYPDMLSLVSHREGPDSYSVAALVHLFVPSWSASIGVETTLGVFVLLLVIAAGRRGRDRDAFALSALGILVLTPLLEMHYLAVLLVLVALYRRFGVAWIVPLLMWGAPEPNNGSGVHRVHVFLVVVLTLALIARDWSNPRDLIRALRPRLVWRPALSDH